LRAIRREWPDVLISDIGLPGQDGYDLMREIRSLEQAGHRAQTPAIALTAYAADVDKRRASEAGFQVHLAKPLDRDALLCTISRLVVEKKVKRSTAGAHTPR